ncbi:ABC transporter-like protein, partial [Neocallimastix californiae]
NEIFAILGHNGAGKTTLMNIMTGILSSTRGEVYYDSVPISITVDVDSILQDINLLSKKEQYPKELSGGQRRKLCITLALLGSPKYVFLDEPTTGLDPYSRKNIWELLSRKKEGRIIFVTTHYMDEADLLADRKMIISNGNISCLGSSLFLKQQFNMNYSLDV